MKYVNFIIMLMCVFMLMGCNEYKVSCSGESEVEGFLELVQEEVYDQLIPIYAAKEYESLDEELNGVSLYDKSFNKYSNIVLQEMDAGLRNQEDLLTGKAMSDTTAAVINDHMADLLALDVSPTLKKIDDEIVRTIVETTFSLSAIRVTSEQPDIKKVTCEANLYFGSDSGARDVVYSIQTVEDGDDQFWIQWESGY